MTSTVQKLAYARAGLLGNPSDGYGGRVLSVTVRNFSARVTLEPSELLRIEPHEQDLNVYKGLHDLSARVKLHGYYGGERLIMAVIKRFVDHCEQNGIELPSRNCTIRYDSTIPRQIGLAGSSAIITATLRGLLAFYGVEIPRKIQPTLALAAETEELGINAGLMDRVVQVYEGLVYMNLDSDKIRSEGHGAYESLDTDLLPDLYLAYDTNLGKVSGQVLNPIRERFDEGDPFVIETLERLAALADEGRAALVAGETERLMKLMNENLDLRSKIMKISEGNRRMIDAARSCGASAKFAGSGGTIIGIYRGEAMYQQLVSAIEDLGARVIKPVI